MVSRNRIKRLEKKLKSDYFRMANDLALNLFFEDIDEETGQDIPMSKAKAIDWIAKRRQVAEWEQRTSVQAFDDAVTFIIDWSNGDFLKTIAPDYPRWPDHLKHYQNETTCPIAAHLMDKFNIKLTP